jgi:hypothetical protein
MFGRKHILSGFLVAGLLLAPCMGTVDAKAPKALGVTETQWQEDLKNIGGEYTFEDTFFSEVLDSQKRLESKYGSEHFEHLNSKKETLREKIRNDSLLQLKPQKARSKFILDHNLSRQEYTKMMNYIPALGTYYGEHHIAQILPYIAFCLNYDVDTHDLNFQLSKALKRETPPDILCERLYRLAEGKM